MVIIQKYKTFLLKSLIILVVAGFFLSGMGFKALAQDQNQNQGYNAVDAFQISKLEMLLVDTLNQDRETAFGIDPILMRTAKVIGQMMIDNDFSRQTEPIDFEQLVSGFGYAYNSVFRLDSAIMSTNYLAEEKAIDLLYASLMEDDVEGFTSLSREIGVSIIQSRIPLNGREVNVYVAVVLGAEPDPGRYGVSDYMADQLEVLLNQFRANPEFVMGNMGYDKDAYSGDVVITTGLPPFRRGIDETAGAGAKSLVSVELDSLDPDRAVMLLFSRMVENNINYLLTDHNMVDIKITYAPSYDDQEQFKVRFSAELKFDYLVQDMDRALIKGVAFKDDNENDIYDPGEGIHFLPLYIPGTGIHMRTGFAGQFQTELKMGWYDILLFNLPKGEYSAYFDTYTMDNYVMFSVLE